MNATQKKCLVLIFGFYAILLTAYVLGFRWNRTRSLQPGIYRLVNGAIQRDGYARVAPNASEWYRMGVEREYYREGTPLLKKIIALEGDVVSYDMIEKGLIIGETTFILLSEIRSKDSAGRDMSMPSFPIRLKPGEAWLGSENERGYDSRYFGPVSMDLLQPARLVWGW